MQRLKKSCEERAFAWLEAPLYGGGEVDAVVADYKKDTLFIIES